MIKKTYPLILILFLALDLPTYGHELNRGHGALSGPDISSSPGIWASDTTVIPDERFEQALIDLGIDSDGIINQQVLTADIDTVTQLDVSYRAIADLSGIENFSALEVLYCSDNDLSALNLTQNVHLRDLECYWNQIASLDLSQNLQLTRLICTFNQLTALDLSHNSLLTELACGANQLTELQVNNNPELTGLACQINQITQIDISSNTRLTHLNVANNQITELDVSSLENLLWLGCGINQLTSLNVSRNSMLTTIFCGENPLTILNIKNGNNGTIATFDATDCPALDCIEVDDAVAANAGTGAYAGWSKDATAGYSENCNPDDDNDGVADELDSCPDTPAGEAADENGCAFSQLEHTDIPDTIFEQALIDLGIDRDNEINHLVATANVSSIESLDVRNKGIHDLTGLEDFVSLTYLNCMENELAELDVSNNTLLTHLNCNTNQLTSLDISNNTLLNYFNCSVNYINGLDISMNTTLTGFYCTTNELTYLNAENGNNEAIAEFDALDNPDLHCIQVDDPQAASQGTGVYSNWNIDETAIYSDDCSSLSRPTWPHSVMQVFPNPSTGILNIDLPEGRHEVRIEVYDVRSEKILEKTIEASKGKMVVDISEQPSGIYFVRLDAGEPRMIKIIKQ